MSDSHLVVRVYCGANLNAADLNGKSDPYVKLKLGAFSTKTKAINKTLSPKWNEQLLVPVPDPQDALLIHVYDKDPIGGDDLLGALRFPLQNLQANGQEDIRVFKLFGGELGSNLGAALSAQGAAATDAATVSVADNAATQFTGNAEIGGLVGKLVKTANKLKKEPSAKNNYDEKQSLEYAVSITKNGLLGTAALNRGVVVIGFALFPTKQAAQSFVPQAPSAGKLTVRLLGAKHLIAADFSTAPSSDPYAILTVGSQKVKSEVVKSTINPTWNQVLGFQQASANDVLQIDIHDKDAVGSDDHLGVASVPLSGLQTGKESIFLVELQGGEMGENAVNQLGSKLQPLKQNVAGNVVEGLVTTQLGSGVGKVAGKVATKVPGISASKERFNWGVVAVGVTLQ